ncbi:hypothetical protein FHR32_002934 [Streptosporangium album]|uniref:Uncharacterized protein n=1 Tax=Streptosporangium album TaxID=47479 RepID=A0A7W7RUS8_9ACTN|nr:hypothetical protein [Streptosporangium album]MBB4938629.1 hypothetical protein [Streptosporangium album]
MAVQTSLPASRTHGENKPPVDTFHLGAIVRAHRPLAFCAAAMVVLAVLSGVGLVVDQRLVQGEPVWLKPFKFAMSFALYAITLAWMVSRVQRWRRTLWWLGTVTVAGFVLPEISAITFQAVRGVRSHFNFSTQLDSTIFAVMGGAAYLGWLMTFALGVFLVLQRRVDRSMAWAVPLGIAVSLAGMSIGYLMTAPTPDQAQAMHTAIKLATIGAHSVGGIDGGAGMPVTGWATETGDLRVAHFFGLHALQALPLFAVVLQSLARRFETLRDVTTRAGLVIVAALGYAGLTGLLLWQAQRGQSPAHPDALTLTVGAALAAAVAILAAGVVVATSRAIRR